MAGIVRIFGMLAVMAGLVAVAYGVFTGLNLQGQASVFWLWAGFGSILSGAALYCFGAITDHLRTIEVLTEKQNDLLERTLNGKR
ncbi:MAG TPA: hypothetical protein VGV39_04610 [Mesorhizobium sp.]|jgi:hypothetical protein|uniref:hypothetical protein n=1 Tax=Mesorhizobium sp. TaxID=1871066 RepID=UPI002DDD34E6|nr:hypothetical protein [Mesorhizobium sp.]HEV2502330.1 hypothetical protein [Mesorhizobium sp.]